MEMIQRHADSKPTLVFCSTRKMAQQAAQAIVKQYETLRKAKKAPPWPQNPEPMGNFIDNTLKGTSNLLTCYCTGIKG
jgi:ATP-dependent DNA helicase HFM1/MER3